MVDDPPVHAVDQLVELDERLGRPLVAVRERAHRDPEHLLGARSHLLEALDQPLVAVEACDELGQLGDRHA